MITEIINKTELAAKNLHHSMGYFYRVSERDFYNIDVRDLFKVCLADIFNPDMLSYLGFAPLQINGSNFAAVGEIAFREFAVRFPYLRRNEAVIAALRERKGGGKGFGSLGVVDKFFHELYNACITPSFVSIEGEFREAFKSAFRNAKNDLSEPPFTAEWFRKWVYTSNTELAVVNNRNMFFLGCMDALFPLFYEKLTAELINTIVREEA